MEAKTNRYFKNPEKLKFAEFPKYAIAADKFQSVGNFFPTPLGNVIHLSKNII